AGEPSDALQVLRAPELALERTALRDVSHHRQVPARKHMRFRGELDVALLAVRAHDAVATCELTGLEEPREHRFELRRRRADVPDRERQNLVARPAEQLARGGVDVDVPPPGVDDHDRLERALE